MEKKKPKFVESDIKNSFKFTKTKRKKPVKIIDQNGNEITIEQLLEEE